MSKLKGHAKNCPACGLTAKTLKKGVCPKCLARFDVEHSKKTEVEWKATDFEIREYKVPGGANDFAIMDEEDAVKAEWREGAVQTMEWFFRGLRLLVQYKGNVTLALHAFCLALKKGDLLEYCDPKTKETRTVQTDVDVAVKLFRNPKRKAAVNKLVLLFQDALGGSEALGHRSQKGRNSMTSARMEQLK